MNTLQRLFSFFFPEPPRPVQEFVLPQPEPVPPLPPDLPDTTHRSRRMKYLYGISEQDYSALFIKQGGACAICRETPGKPLVVDHCHKTQTVRGLLCDHCNRGLRQFRDNVIFLREAAHYLEH